MKSRADHAREHGRHAPCCWHIKVVAKALLIKSTKSQRKYANALSVAKLSRLENVLKQDFARKLNAMKKLSNASLLELLPESVLQKSDIRDVGDHAAANQIVLNSSGLATTGIDLAMLTTRKVRKIF